MTEALSCNINKTIINPGKDTKMKKKYLAIIPIILILYFNTPIHIKQYYWKSNGGGRISDFVHFNDTNYFVLKWPFIYKNQEKSGYIVFCFYLFILLHIHQYRG